MGEEALDKLGSAFSSVAEIAAGAFGLISGAVIKSIDEYAESEAAANALTRALVNNGSYTKELAGLYNEYADALSKSTLFTDDSITKAQTQFTQQARGVELTKEATSAILDFAQAQGIDAAQAAELVGKSVGTGTNALARYGIEVSATASKSEKMAQVLTGLNAKFGGQAEAATSGLGAIKMLQKSIGGLFEKFGEKLAPLISGVASAINSFVNDSKEIEPVMDALKEVFIFLLKSGAGVQEMFVVLGKTIGTVFAGSVESISQAMKGNFSQAKDVVVMSVKEIGSVAEQSANSLADKLKAIDDLSVEDKKANQEKEKQNLIQSLAAKKEIKIADELSDRERQLSNLITDSELKSQMELALLSAKNSAVYAAEAAAADKRYQLATTQKDKTKALEDKFRATELANQAKYNEAREAMQKESLSIIASLAKSGNDRLAVIGKAAALTQIALETPVAIGRALSAAPPPFNFALAAGVAAAMAAQTANVLGVPLAEGGIVMPRPGGTQATIGEAGEAEAVIPLSKMGDMGLGGGTSITLVVNGGLLGNESDAQQFAIAIDKELFKLRRNNQSVAFDSGVV